MWWYYLTGVKIIEDYRNHLFPVQTVVGSIVAGHFAGSKKPRCREMSARVYALHSVCPQLSFFPLQPDAFTSVKLRRKHSRSTMVSIWSDVRIKSYRCVQNTSCILLMMYFFNIAY